MPLGSARLLCLGIVLTTACVDEPAPPLPDCSGDRCQSTESRDELLEAVTDFQDPISAYLRDAVQDDGTLAGDYRDVLDGVGDVLGCPPSSEKSFVVLSNESYNAKSIFNRCASSPAKASEFFLLLPALNVERDVEPGLIHMTGWDQEAQRYRRYSTFPAQGGGMHINVEPSYCLDCHAGPRDLGTWQPLMNEMTNPWSQWNAQPGFESQLFDEYLDEATSEGAVFSEVMSGGLLDSASNFEPIIRAGIDRVTGARIKSRHNEADVEQALELLQPLFCDEMSNFVSEIHGSGEIRSAALIDDSFRELLSAMEVGGDLAFMADTTLRIPPRRDGESNLSLVAVRGESSLRAELSLVTRQVLRPIDVLQVRSLDWKQPVDSSFRCELFEMGSQRIRQNEGQTLLDGLASGASNADLLPLLLAEIMTIDLAGERLSLQPSDALYDLFDAADLPADSQAWEGLLATPEALAERLQLALDGATREAIDAARQGRGCRAAERYATAPLIPDVNCP